MCRRQTCLAVLVLLLGVGMIAQADVGDGLKGLWEFGNADDLTAATVGNDLVLAGGTVHTAVAGVGAGDGAVSIGIGSYYECTAGIAANGGGSWVNEYTLLFDVKYPTSSAGKWRAFLNTNNANSNDGDYFIHPSDESWGVAAIGYTDNAAVGEFYSSPDTWYRVVMSVDMGDTNPFFKLYIDGTLVATHTSSLGLDGRHSLYTDPAVTLLLFADENGEDAEMHCSAVAIWDRPLTAEEIAVLGGPGDTIVLSRAPAEPNPSDGATDVPRDVVLSWTPGEFAATHDVYFGTVYEDVNDADTTNTLDVLVGPGQDANTYDVGRLELGQTYYWRVDEVNAPPESTVFKGGVWSFTVEPYSRPIAGGNITATASSSTPDTSPEKTIDGSGLDADDQHSTGEGDMWLSGPLGPQPTWIQYAFDKSYQLDQMLVWNSNQKVESYVGFGAKNVTIEYSADANDWTVLGEFEFARAPGEDTCTADTTVDFGGVSARYVRLTITSNWEGLVQQYGLSEVRFLYIPMRARQPEPASGASDVAPQLMLSWRAGREAATHQVYLNTNEQAVIDGTAPVVIVPESSFDTGVLDLAQTYYWKVNEVNETAAFGVWEGDVWSFTTQKYIVVDDFEAYDDDIEAGTTIWQNWIDGLEDPTHGGAVVGNAAAPFAEQIIVHTGGQSMNFEYDNPSASAISEADHTLAPPQNWTASGIKSLSLWFHGAAGNTGVLYVKINGTEILYDGEADDIAIEAWLPWNIDLTTAGVNVSNVTVLTVGVKGVGAGLVYFDDIRLYPLAPEVVQPIAPDDGDSSLLGLWKLDDGGGTIAADSSGNNRNGVFKGAPQWIAGGATGGALQLDGVDDYVVLDTINYGDATGADFSVALWVKTDGWNDDAAMISNKDWDSGGNPGWAIAGGAGNNGSWQWNYGDGQGRADFDPPVSLSRISGGEWHHICVTHDRDGLAKFYYDGALIGEEDISTLSGSLDAGLPTVLGTDGAEGTVWAYWFTGAFDDVRIYDRVLSHDEVAGLTGRTAPLHQGF